MLCDIVRIKMKNFDLMKTKTQTADEYIKQFLDKDIKPLWPKGWMQTRQECFQLLQILFLINCYELILCLILMNFS